MGAEPYLHNNMQRIIRPLHIVLMKRFVGISCIALVLSLTFPLHFGAAFYALCDGIGDHLKFSPDAGSRLLIGVPGLVAGQICMGCVVIGMICRLRIAFWIAGLAFLTGTGVIMYFELTGIGFTYRRQLFDAFAAIICLGCTAYCWRLSLRYSHPIVCSYANVRLTP